MILSTRAPGICVKIQRHSWLYPLTRFPHYFPIIISTVNNRHSLSQDLFTEAKHREEVIMEALKISLIFLFPCMCCLVGLRCPSCLAVHGHYHLPQRLQSYETQFSTPLIPVCKYIPELYFPIRLYPMVIKTVIYFPVLEHTDDLCNL